MHHPQWQSNGMINVQLMAIIMKLSQCFMAWLEHNRTTVNEATTDGFWHATECSKHSIFNTKTPFGNWSSYYAMAVIELGQEIKAARQR